MPIPDPHEYTGAPVTAIVLAADRGPDDPVAAAAGTVCKALAPVAGTPMVVRVLDALAACRSVQSVRLCGPPRDRLAHCPELLRRIEQGEVDWLPSRETPSASAAAALDTVPAGPVLLTTADHALLTPALVDEFIAAAMAGPWDAVAGLVNYDVIARHQPATRRTVTRLRDGGYCGTNLFAFPTIAGRRLVPYWRRVEQDRKKPWRVLAGAIGYLALWQYLLGRLTLEGALAHLSRRLDVRVGAVLLSQAEAAIDVDTAADLALVESILTNRQQEADRIAVGGADS